MIADNVIVNFQINAPISSIEPYGGGHINDTYRVQCRGTDLPDYLLQKVNTYVFKDGVGLMNNISLVTSHIRAKLIQKGVADFERRSLALIKTKEGELYFTNPEGEIWRVFNFVENSKVYDKAPNPEIAFEGARMFGDFLNALADLNPNQITDTIPNFHNIGFRFENLEKSITENSAGRVGKVSEEIKYVRSRHDIMSVIQHLGEKGAIPPRIVHNDTKINNVLFDQQDKGLCIIDLDTIMPGYVHYDFGDGIRTSANTSEEDEEDLNKMNYDLEMFEAFSAGYIESTHNLLTKEEINSLAHGALLFPFIMGVRFLTDYIAGDIYYKIKHPEHNLIRARAQLKLAQDGEAKFNEMKKIIRKLVSDKI